MFSLSGKSKNQIPCFPCAVATLEYYLETFFAENCMKMKEIGATGRARILTSSPPPPQPTLPVPPLFRNGSSFLCSAILKGLTSETLKVPLVINVRHQHSHYKWLIFAGTIILNGSTNSNVNLLIYESIKHYMDGNKCA